MAPSLARQWNQRVRSWHSHVTASAGFEQVLSRLLEIAHPTGSDVCVDLGAGTGFVTLALAPHVASVLAVDISPAMAQALTGKAAAAGQSNVATEVADLVNFRLPAGSVNLVVSNYALHHLIDADKRRVVAQAADWLRPGGRLVVADMMFGRGASSRDRTILRQKVTSLAAKGPGGWWRIAKNLGRYGLGVGQEHPASPELWKCAFHDAGFVEVSFDPVIAEAGVVHGLRQ